ncbi:EcsC protein family protein [Pilibacter termitis]|uniref:EcsC protein family protein n=1 Tax=Pilibacter termitis TaxID=263852 RepID=A0A1T4P0K9_9ENTE|nr:EcsC family protein [Pilibacter termitis]SJZ84528.1 EcsC protein family protein [Pilibacter termitis]
MNNNEKKEVEKTMVSREKMLQVLDWAYDKTLTGLPGEKSIYDLVEDYLSKHDKETAIKKLVKFQITKATTSGFVTGFGGILTMPITIPANVTSVILFQMRMIAAIALIRGYDLKSDQVQTFVYATLAGTSVADIMKKTGIVIGNKMLRGVVQKVPGKTLTKINQAVGFRLITKFGTKGAVNLGKVIPVAGAVVGGTFDALTTKTIAQLAKKTFTEVGIDMGDGTIIDKKDLIL